MSTGPDITFGPKDPIDSTFNTSLHRTPDNDDSKLLEGSTDAKSAPQSEWQIQRAKETALLKKGIVETPEEE